MQRKRGMEKIFSWEERKRRRKKEKRKIENLDQ